MNTSSTSKESMSLPVTEKIINSKEGIKRHFILLSEMKKISPTETQFRNVNDTFRETCTPTNWYRTPNASTKIEKYVEYNIKQIEFGGFLEENMIQLGLESDSMNEEYDNIV